jgi:hypothetical protein
MKAFVRTVREIDYHDVISSGLFVEEFPDQHPHVWVKQSLITLPEATEAYLVEAIATSQCYTAATHSL